VSLSPARVAVVTGGSSGIGAAIARRLAKDGWHCVLLARREERLGAVAREVGGEYEICDVSDRKAVERVAATVCKRHPKIGVLVNNAGIPARTGFLDGDPERIEQTIRTNYLGGVWCLRAFLPALEAAAPSHVVNIVSVAGTVAFPPSGPYSAAKHAQLAFSRATSSELPARGITVHTVNPGFVKTEGFPQKGLMRNRLLRHAVAEPALVAERVARALRSGRRELFVPAWYRPAALAQALAPSLLGRLLGSRVKPKAFDQRG
jgi:short-subunit dehydrogenase